MANGTRGAICIVDMISSAVRNDTCGAICALMRQARCHFDGWLPPSLNARVLACRTARSIFGAQRIIFWGVLRDQNRREKSYV